MGYVDRQSTMQNRGLDWSASADDYATHRAGFPEAIFERLRAHGIGLPGQAVVDLGTGTGTLARGFARCADRVVGVDVASESLAAARGLAEAEGVYVNWMEAPAESTGLVSHDFDVVSAGQCWHWFDRPRVAAECRRLLRRGGRLVIAHFDFLACAVVDETARVIRELGTTPQPVDVRAGLGIYPRWFDDCVGAGFAAVESFTFDVHTPYTTQAWRGRMRASNWLGRMEAEEARLVDNAIGAVLARHPATFTVPHRVFALLASSPAPS